jgi:hypothetical protein
MSTKKMFFKTEAKSLKNSKYLGRGEKKFSFSHCLPFRVHLIEHTSTPFNIDEAEGRSQ